MIDVDDLVRLSLIIVLMAGVFAAWGAWEKWREYCERRKRARFESQLTRWRVRK